MPMRRLSIGHRYKRGREDADFISVVFRLLLQRSCGNTLLFLRKWHEVVFYHGILPKGVNHDGSYTILVNDERILRISHLFLTEIQVESYPFLMKDELI